MERREHFCDVSRSQERNPVQVCSNSEIQDFKQCKRKWYLKYFLGLASAEKKIGPLALGTRIHACLAAYYTPGGTELDAMSVLEISIAEDRKVVDIEDMEAFDKEAKLARIMVEGYFDWVSVEGVDSDLDIIEAEAEIEAPINIRGEAVWLRGKRDAIGKRRSDGLSVLIDFKTAASFNDPMLDLNEQGPTYLLLQKLNGNEAIQYCYWRLLKKVLRTGRAKPPFYDSVEMYVSDEELRNFYERIHGEISDILRTRDRLKEGESDRTVCYPSPSSMCSWKCEFRVVCPMMDDGSHFEDFLKDNFQKTNPYARYETKGEE
jgi:hypothetical protein